MPASEKSVAAITFCHIQRGNSSDSAGVGMVKMEQGVSAIARNRFVHLRLGATPSYHVWPP